MKCNMKSNSVADPGFPVEGGCSNLVEGRADSRCGYLTKKFAYQRESIWTLRGCAPAAPPGSANEINLMYGFKLIKEVMVFVFVIEKNNLILLMGNLKRYHMWEISISNKLKVITQCQTFFICWITLPADLKKLGFQKKKKTDLEIQRGKTYIMDE